MSQKFDFVKDIDDSKETWCHAVRIIEFWTVINRKGIEHLEMVIMDANCDEIQILIRHDHTQKWKDFLKEDMTCVINNGNMYDNDFQWKLCDHSKKFVFLSGTIVKPIVIANIPHMKFYFKDFADIMQGIYFFGVFHEIKNIQEKTSGKKVVVSLKFRDLKGNIINCSLWENDGSKFTTDYNDVSNGWSGSKLLFNEVISKIQDFLSKLPLSEKNEKPIQSAKSFSNWSGGSQFTIIDRYNVEIWCNRGDTKYRFMFWDVDCTQIIGKAVVTLHTTMVEGGEDNHMVYLDDLDQDPSRRRK
ncbi:uncharacterized protein LOC127137236 [Lathyrus oleraceus]|uniref:uncharacterized protein LOC127137236 n=1 Tax=Pisum sativum TaxID=3888 RepID=UPI0021CE3A34|nr:uncharacterized protein LOC127137236 [Pisum sativum]